MHVFCEPPTAHHHHNMCVELHPARILDEFYVVL